MERQAGEATQPIEESKISSSDPTIPPEETIILNKLYPKAKQDLDALFPEPNMKKLLKEVVRTRQRNERFLKRIALTDLYPEGDDESPEAP